MFRITVSSNHQLRARRALMQFNNVPLRTRTALLLYKVYGDNALFVLNGTSMNSANALLVLSRRNMIISMTCISITFQRWIRLWPISDKPVKDPLHAKQFSSFNHDEMKRIEFNFPVCTHISSFKSWLRWISSFDEGSYLEKLFYFILRKYSWSLLY